MNLPEMLPIERIEDYHSHYLGETKDGRLFWGYETFGFPTPFAELRGKDWQKYRREYAILHTFDREGNYLQTRHWCGGTTADLKVHPELLSVKLEEMVGELGDIEFKDIEIKLFQTIIDGLVFGLVPNREAKFIELQPSSTIAFQEPWDGAYYT